jgi:hypothetical protein
MSLVRKPINPCHELLDRTPIGDDPRAFGIQLHNPNDCATDLEFKLQKSNDLTQTRQDLFRWICSNEDRRRKAHGLPCSPLLRSVAALPEIPHTNSERFIPFVSPFTCTTEAQVDTKTAIDATWATFGATESVLVAV